jgi:hypothetical protein
MSSKSNQQKRLRRLQVREPKPTNKLTAFPAQPGEFDDVPVANLSPAQAHFLNGIKGQFPDAKPVTRKGSGLLHILTPESGMAMQTPEQIRAL